MDRYYFEIKALNNKIVEVGFIAKSYKDARRKAIEYCDKFNYELVREL